MSPSLSPASSTVSWKRDLWLLTLVFVVLLGVRLGSHPLANPDEARYAEVPREMLASGDWVTPRLNDVVYFEKPPFVYWAGAVGQAVFGRNEWAARLVPAVFALGGVLLTYAAGRRLFGREAGWLAGGVLGTTVLYFALGRTLLLDGPLSVLMSATLFCFILGVREPTTGGGDEGRSKTAPLPARGGGSDARAEDERGSKPGLERRPVAGVVDPGPGSASRAAGASLRARRRWFFYGLYASAALAVLTKGLIGVLLSGLVMFVWLLVFNQWKRLRPLYLPSGVLLFLAIAVPWHVLVAQRNPNWAHFYFVQEHWERFTTTAHGRYEPWWYFLPVVALGFFPWVGFIGPALRRALAGGWSARKQNADTWFLVTWAVVMFLFFSKSQSKLIPYILPVFPPLAVLVGAYLAPWIAAGVRLRSGATGPTPPGEPTPPSEVLGPGADAAVRHGDPMPGGAPRGRVGFWVFAAVSALLGAALVVAVLKPGIIRDTTQAAALRPYGLVLGAWLLVAAVAVPWIARRRGARPAVMAIAGSIAVFYVGLAFAQVHIARPDTKELARVVVERMQPGDRVLHYRDFFHDFTFYAARAVDVVGYYGELEVKEDPRALASGRFMDEAEFRRRWEQPGRLWVVARKRAVGELFGDPSFRYHLIAEGRGHYLFSNQP